MEVSEFLKAKRQLEADLAALIDERVQRFRMDTGYLPDSIAVHTICVRRIDLAVGAFVIDRVAVGITLEA